MCDHELNERETSAADGMCPICLAAEIVKWNPIATAPMNTPVLVCGKCFGELVVTGAELTKFGWSVVGVSGYEFEVVVEPLYWANVPSIPENGIVEPSEDGEVEVKVASK